MDWIGVDLDGTLAKRDFGGDTGVAFDPDHIGDPIDVMVERVRRWLYDGKEVRIFTARAGHPNFNAATVATVHAWLAKLGIPPLPVTCVKDYEMKELWDDQCVQVEQNTGRRVDGKE